MIVKNKYKLTIKEALILFLKNQPSMQARLSEIYLGVNGILKRDVAPSVIRGVIYMEMKRSQDRKATIITRVAPGIYRLASGGASQARRNVHKG